ncbi:stromal processing peptidase, chloroplastic-like [Telopea speciosissima]|uniref:stromal processing peptidase, chloroplastic-like n=1 Tax=Telopea speciosissima TaxID=54955 RepID=UPI001CC6FB52|nr:stromal processing peptidase, chloroplastic-like [Telopea speciosissima]
MASSSSITAKLPHVYSSRFRDECSPRTRLSLLLPLPSAICRTATSFDGKHHPIRSTKRWPHEGRNVRSHFCKKRNRMWKEYSSVLDEQVAIEPLSEQRGCISCFQSLHKCRTNNRKFSPRVLHDESALPLLKHSLDKSFVKPSHVPFATIGPDEPHVASTTWSDAVLEKQSQNFLDPEIEKAELEGFLSSDLPSHPKLYRGQLKNGLRYLILPNKVPANRFEAHIEVHVGSIDEEDDEQGIAHMIEHVAFLGSKKREKLLGTGARSNAYTDFHHTVFHIHSPTTTKDSDADLLPLVLDALNEIAFHPKFLASRVEKERRAILSELQMMNTIEYRVDCQLLQHLHSENKLSKRFPIGLEDQIKKWDSDKIRKFHERWYYPENATLYIVGDINDIPKTVNQIEAVFGHTGVENVTLPAPSPNTFGVMASFLVPKLPIGLAGSLSNEKSSLSMDQMKTIKKQRHAIRPSVKHKWSIPGSGEDAKPPQIFQHELLQNFSINLFCKIPVNKVQTYGDLRNVLMKRIFLSALHFRINTRYKSSNPPFTSVELDHSDSGREGCTVTTLTVTAEPRNWQSAIKVAVQEVRRLKEFGVTKGELARYMDALLKDSEQLAAMIDNVPSVDNLDFIMESEALGHTVMDQRQGHGSLVAVTETVTLEEVNSTGAKVLEFISNFGKPNAPPPAAIVACIPKNVHVDEIGETEFRISPCEITAAIQAGLKEPIDAEPELEVPKELISSSQLQQLRLQQRPSFIPLTQEGNILLVHDNETGITQRRLSNGIPVNYKITKIEASSGVYLGNMDKRGSCLGALHRARGTSELKKRNSSELQRCFPKAPFPGQLKGKQSESDASGSRRREESRSTATRRQGSGDLADLLCQMTEAQIGFAQKPKQKLGFDHRSVEKETWIPAFPSAAAFSGDAWSL